MFCIIETALFITTKQHFHDSTVVQSRDHNNIVLGIY